MCTDLRDYPVAVRCTEQGTTLIELVMAIDIAGVMIVGLMTAYASIAGRSADPMIRTQAISLAESYLEEALLKPFLAPDGSVCPASAPTGNREDFVRVCDYNNYNSSSITLPNGAAVAGLAGYSVAMSVATTSDLDSVPSNCALKVTVNITTPLNETVSLIGYRTQYESDPACS